MKIKKIITILILIFCISNSVIYADDEIEEEIDLQEITNETAQVSTEPSKEPKLDSRIGIIYDRQSKRILYGKNEQKQVPMASTTKIMTALIVLENADLKEQIEIGAKAASTGGSRLGLKKGDKITIHDLLYGLMLKSGNDAAVALAIHVGGSIEGFAKLMNQRAEQLELKNTHFVTPHGLDQQEHYTTAYELAKLTDEALRNNEFAKIVSTKSYTITINGYPKLINNTNELLGYLDGVTGVKTGFTNQAGRCLVTSVNRNGFEIITVVLGADTKKIRTTDSIKLIEYAYQTFTTVNIEEKAKQEFEKWKQINENRIIVNKGKKATVELSLKQMEYPNKALKKDEIDNITFNISNIYQLEAPVEKGMTLGNIKIKIGEETLDMIEIYVAKTIEKKGIWDYFLHFLKLYIDFSI